MPRIYYCTAEEIEPIYDDAAELVTAKRRKKAERLLKKEDRLLSVGTSLMLRSVLKINSDEEMLYNEHGKPYLEHGPCFSISHSGNTAVLAVSENEIGADIEKLRTPDIRIAKRSFSEENGSSKFSIKVKRCDYKRDIHRANVAALKTAYLLAFAKLGYHYILNENLEKIREQILHPDMRFSVLKIKISLK